MTDAYIRFFQYSWILIGLSGLFPLYLNKSGLKSKQDALKVFVGAAVFIALGLIVQSNYTGGIELTSSEVTIILGIAAVAYVARLLPIIYENSLVRYEQTIPLRRDMKFKLVKTSFEKIKAKLILEEGLDKLVVKTKGNYGMEFLMSTEFQDGIKSPVTYRSHPFGSSYGRYRLLFLLAAYTSVIALSEKALNIPIPLFSSRIDAELFFALFAILLYSFLFLQNSIQHNFFLEFEQLQKFVLPELAKSTYSLEKEDGDGMNIDLKSDLDSVKERARKMKDVKAKQAIDEKRKKARERISNIIGNSEDEDVDPELVKKQLLIRRVKTLLKSTPIGYKATLTMICEKVEAKNEKEIEAIIVGLIDRKEVQGGYNMWAQEYSNGDVSSQFIDRTLNKLDLDPSELEFIKVSSSGDVEIRFKNEHINGNSVSTDKKVTKKTKKSES